jgi:hypothetical protein
LNRSGQRFLVATSVVDVPVRLGFEGTAGSNVIVVPSPTGEPLATVDVPSSEIEFARAQWRIRTVAAEGAVLCGVLLLLSGPLLD